MIDGSDCRSEIATRSPRLSLRLLRRAIQQTRELFERSDRLETEEDPLLCVIRSGGGEGGGGGSDGDGDASEEEYLTNLIYSSYLNVLLRVRESRDIPDAVYELAAQVLKVVPSRLLCG